MVFDVFMYSLINPSKAFREVYNSKSKGFLAFLLAFALAFTLGAIGYKASVKYFSSISMVFLLLMLGTLFITFIAWFVIKSFHGVKEHVVWDSDISRGRFSGVARAYDVSNIKEEGFVTLFVKFLVSSIPIHLLMGIGMLLQNPIITMILVTVGVIWGAYVFAEGEAKTINLPFAMGYKIGIYNSVMAFLVYVFFYILLFI